MLIKRDKPMIEVPQHRHSCPTMSGNFIVGERGRSSKRGRKPKWKQGLRKHKHQYSSAKDNSPYKSLIKTQDLPSHASTTERRVEDVRQLGFVMHRNMRW